MILVLLFVRACVGEFDSLRLTDSINNKLLLFSKLGTSICSHLNLPPLW